MSDETSDASKTPQSSNTPKPGEETPDGKSGEGFWYIEGQPTRVLSIDEYREWVRKDIASKILTRLAAIFSVVGVGAITAFYITLQKSGDAVETRLDTEV